MNTMNEEEFAARFEAAGIAAEQFTTVRNNRLAIGEPTFFTARQMLKRTLYLQLVEMECQAENALRDALDGSSEPPR